MEFSIKSLLVATAWVASSCVIATSEASLNGTALVGELRQLVLACVVAHAIFNPNVAHRAFLIGFGFAVTFLNHNYLIPSLYIDKFWGVGWPTAQLVQTDVAGFLVGLSSQWGHARGQKAA